MPPITLKGLTVGDRLFNFIDKGLVLDLTNKLCAYIEMNPEELGFFQSFFKSKKTFPDYFRVTFVDLDSVTVDENGNVYTWKTSGGIYCDESIDEVELKGTVKAHNEYRGVKQTELTRCKPTYIIRKSENAEKRAERFRKNIGAACVIR